MAFLRLFSFMPVSVAKLFSPRKMMKVGVTLMLLLIIILCRAGFKVGPYHLGQGGPDNRNRQPLLLHWGMHSLLAEHTCLQSSQG